MAATPFWTLFTNAAVTVFSSTQSAPQLSSPMLYLAPILTTKGTYKL
jgi:hypothetical protein